MSIQYLLVKAGASTLRDAPGARGRALIRPKRRSPDVRLTRALLREVCGPHNYLGLTLNVQVIALPWLISGTICDVTIATTLSVYLSSRRTGFERTDALIKKIIFATISNGLLTASFTTSHMISYLASESGIHMIFNYGVVKLYTNSVISSLNSRQVDSDAIPQFGPNYGDDKESNSTSSKGSIRPQVNITVETHEMVDIGPLPQSDSMDHVDEKGVVGLSSMGDSAV
ncbi:hypothetical protein PsYK624_081880 [Phanerochaete sordida]|uniref:DUF6534 domain-containing protein n=1 Tax=Phanerochaete sordida TaxID=48140 RepID=A0A9P3LE94_9APHY|nr:hypothetical protein PsYK624_081880 [Phanerochaete sordida]